LTLDPFGVTELYPTTGGGKEWFCNWQSGSLRYIAPNTYDATDTDFGTLMGSTHESLRVSCGEAHIKNYGEYRLFVNGPWTNTEMTIFARIRDTSTSSIQLRGRANHHGVGFEPYADVAREVPPEESPQGVFDINSCGFGNYFVRWGQSTNPLDFVDVGLEIIHELYTLGHALVDPYDIPNDEWIGYKLVTRTLANGHVKVEGYNNMNADKTTWTLATEYDFDGSNAPVSAPNLALWQEFEDYCADKGDMIGGDVNANQLFLDPAKWNFVRINTATRVDLKYMSVREIVPF